MKEFLNKNTGLISFSELERRAGIPSKTIYKFLAGKGNLNLGQQEKIRKVLIELHTDIFTLAL